MFNSIKMVSGFLGQSKPLPFLHAHWNEADVWTPDPIYHFDVVDTSGGCSLNIHIHSWFCLHFKVFLKIDKFGNGLEIDQARLGMCKQLGDVFTEEKFRYMCILSGCDYLPSIHGIGLGKSCKLIKIANNPDIIKVMGSLHLDLSCIFKNLYG